MYPYSLSFDDEVVYSTQQPHSTPSFPEPNVKPSHFEEPPNPSAQNRDPYKYPPRRDHKRHPNPGPKPGNYPPGEPPLFKPERAKGGAVFAVDPGAIVGCMHNYTYIWLANGHSFWMYITFVGRQSVSGYRWGRFGWTYTGLDLRTIENFSCSRH